MYAVGEVYKSKNGLVGHIVKINGVKTLQVVNKLGRITQNIILRKIDLTKFERVEDECEENTDRV